MELCGDIISLLDDDSNDGVDNTLAIMTLFEMNKPFQSSITFESDTDFPDSSSEDDSETYKHEKRTKLPCSNTKKSRRGKHLNTTNEIYSPVKIKTEPGTLNDETLYESSSTVEINSKTFVSEGLSLTTGGNFNQIQKQLKTIDSDLNSFNIISKEKSLDLENQNKKELNLKIKLEPLDYDLMHHGNKNSNQMLNICKVEQIDAKSLTNESAKFFSDMETEKNKELKVSIIVEPLEETNVLHNKDVNKNMSELQKVVSIEPKINRINMIPVDKHKITSEKQDGTQTSSKDTSSATNEPTNTNLSNPQSNERSEAKINKRSNYIDQNNMSASENDNQITLLINNILDVINFIGNHEHDREKLKKYIISGNNKYQLEFKQILFSALMKSWQIVESQILSNMEYKNPTFIRYLANKAKEMAIDEHKYFNEREFLKTLCYFIKESFSLNKYVEEYQAKEKQNHGNEIIMKHQNHNQRTTETNNQYQLSSKSVLKENKSHKANLNPARTLNINGILVEIPPIVTAQCAVNKKLNDSKIPDIFAPATKNNSTELQRLLSVDPPQSPAIKDLSFTTSKVHYQYGGQLISNSNASTQMNSAFNRNLQQNAHYGLQNQMFLNANNTRKCRVKHVLKRQTLSANENIRHQTSSESNILPVVHGMIHNSRPTKPSPSHTSKSHLYQASDTFHHSRPLRYQKSSSLTYHQLYSTACHKSNPASYEATNPAGYQVSNPPSYPVSNSLSHQASNLHSRISNPPSYQSLDLPSFHVSNPPAYKASNPPSYQSLNSSYLLSNQITYNASNQPSHPAPNTASYPVLNSPAYHASNSPYPALNRPSYPVSYRPSYQTSNPPSRQAPNPQVSPYPTSNPPPYQITDPNNRSIYQASNLSLCQPQSYSTANTSLIRTHTKPLQSPNFYPGPTHYRHLMNQPVSQNDKNQTCGTVYEQRSIHPNCNPASQTNQTGISNTDNLRSSISRDSGFMSPSRSGSTDQMVLSGCDVPQLTALNADRTCNTKLSSCIMCGKGTLQKCGRCFMVSVCSNLCMELAWTTNSCMCRRKKC